MPASVLKADSLQPLPGYALVKPSEMQKQTASGIYLPDSHDEKPQEGKVLAKGPGKTDENGKVVPIKIDINSRVIYKKWGGTELKVGGKEYLLVKEEDILAVIEG